MDKEKFLKIKSAFEKRGGVIQCDEPTDRYLDYKKAEGLTYNEDLILLKTNASASAVFEELIHATQYKRKRNDGTYENRLLMEIEAQEKLIKYKKALLDYYEELKDFRKGN